MVRTSKYEQDVQQVAGAVVRHGSRSFVLVGSTLHLPEHLSNPSASAQTYFPQFCSYAVQAGYTVSRSRLRTFKHNDVADLERVIQELEAEEKAKRWVNFDRHLNSMATLQAGVHGTGTLPRTLLWRVAGLGDMWAPAEAPCLAQGPNPSASSYGNRP